LTVKQYIRKKVTDLVESSVDAVLALISLVIDALFWIGWAYITKWSGSFIDSLAIKAAEAWPYNIAQWTGCGILAAFAIFRTLKDFISLWDNFTEFLKNRKNNRKP
jgi:hypothetical protein